MAGNFVITRSNFTSIQDPDTISDIQFRAWARFLNEHSLIRYALTTEVELNFDALRDLYWTSVDSSNSVRESFTFTALDREFVVTEHDVNRILRFPVDNLVPDPSSDEISEFFHFILCQQEDFTHGKLYKVNLTRHWNFFFHTLLCVFQPRLRGFNSITEPIRRIGFAVAHNRKINYGKILIRLMINKMTKSRDMNILESKVECYYPRFLQLILNDLLSGEQHE